MGPSRGLPITTESSANGTGFTRRRTPTAGCPWDLPGPEECWGWEPGLGSDCLLCHGGKVAGQIIVGLGNCSLDMQSLYEDLAAADGLDPVMPLTLCNARGTSEASNFAIYLMQFRDAELSGGCRSSTRSAPTSVKTFRPGGISERKGRSTTWDLPTAVRSGHSCRSCWFRAIPRPRSRHASQTSQTSGRTY